MDGLSLRVAFQQKSIIHGLWFFCTISKGHIINCLITKFIQDFVCTMWALLIGVSNGLCSGNVRNASLHF